MVRDPHEKNVNIPVFNMLPGIHKNIFNLAEHSG